MGYIAKFAALLLIIQLALVVYKLQEYTFDHTNNHRVDAMLTDTRASNKGKPTAVLGTEKSVNISEYFDFDIFNSFCEAEESLKAVLPIYSTVNRFEIRNILRKTLGKWARTLHCKIFFILGTSLNNTVMKHVAEEYVKEKDILMMENIDSYRGLNDKAVAMVTWISKHCTNVPYVIHLIDDTYVNIPLFLNHMDRMKKANYILGGYNLDVKAPRDSRLKTFVTKEEYPRDRFPAYALGFAYAFPTSVAQSLLAATHKAEYCWIEDVWLTGHVRMAAGVEVENLQRAVEWIVVNEDQPIKQISNVLPPCYIAHSVNPELFYKMYPTVRD